MKKLVVLLFICFWASIGLNAQHVSIIPQPLEVELSEKTFQLNAQTIIVASSECKAEASYLQEMLKPAYSLEIKKKGKQSIQLIIDQSLFSVLAKEGYQLKVEQNSIQITAANQAGIFYGIQSLRQLMPLQIDHSSKPIEIPCLQITDYPRFEWRALMLDEARHFKGMEQVKKILDQMALLKMNVFHWHLTDDQGWRIEIKKYPLLTEVGGFRKDTQRGGWGSEKRSGEAHGGFYTQKEIKEIIDYAAERHISIVPEIEMPGHASSAIAAYPWLGTIGVEIEVPVVFGKMDDSYNVTDPKVYEFLEDVLAEVMELFPGTIIHIGGDEVKFDAWKNSAEVQQFMRENELKSPADLQLYFTNNISNFIEKNDHRMMGWNEIVGGNIHEWQKDSDFETREKLAGNAIVHFWKGDIALVNDAVTKGYDIVNSHHIDTYLDYSYEYTPLDKAYAFDPIPKGLEEQFHSKVLGSGCQMWSEWIPEIEDMDRMIFPRIAAYAEVGWSIPERKNYQEFRKNLEPILNLWKDMGIQYSQKFEKKDFEKDEK